MKENNIKMQEKNMKYVANLKANIQKLAQISRNTLVFIEYFQSEIHKEIQGNLWKKRIPIEDKLRFINITQK